MVFGHGWGGGAGLVVLVMALFATPSLCLCSLHIFLPPYRDGGGDMFVALFLPFPSPATIILQVCSGTPSSLSPYLPMPDPPSAARDIPLRIFRTRRPAFALFPCLPERTACLPTVTLCLPATYQEGRATPPCLPLPRLVGRDRTVLGRTDAGGTT